MAIRNNHWYNLNEQRYYPLDDTASAVSDAGDFLPNQLLADLRLRWPVTYGKYAFLSAAAITPYLVTVLIEATDDLDNSPTSSVLIAGITIPKDELTTGKTYFLTSFKPGAGGFIVIGSGVDELYSGRFSSPRQSLLTPRAARASRVPPVPSIGVENAAVPLTGLVNLTAVSPLQLTKETRIINNVEYENVVVFRLVETAQRIATNAAAESVFSTFAGPCGKRVGSKTCSDPQPIQTINSVGPDCDGIMILDFQGCATVGRNVNDCSVIVDCDLGLSLSCQPPYLPNLTTGELPSELPPHIIPPPLPPEPPVVPTVSISETVETILSLPYCDTFDEAYAYGFSPMGDSSFGFISDDSPDETFCCSGPPPADTSYGCSHDSVSVSGHLVPPIQVASSYATLSQNAQARTNISIFTSDVQCLYRTYTTDVKIVQGVTGSFKNAGIVLNYRLASATLVNYLVARIDIDNSIFGVYFFNGLNLISLSTVAVPSVRTDDWYRIRFQAVPNETTRTSVLLWATLTGVTDPSISVTINTSLSSNLWVTDAANAGFYAQRSKSYFSFWRIDEVLP
jgi:hypothetical protein